MWRLVSRAPSPKQALLVDRKVATGFGWQVPFGQSMHPWAPCPLCAHGPPTPCSVSGACGDSSVLRRGSCGLLPVHLRLSAPSHELPLSALSSRPTLLPSASSISGACPQGGVTSSAGVPVPAALPRGSGRASSWLLPTVSCWLCSGKQTGVALMDCAGWTWPHQGADVMT